MSTSRGERPTFPGAGPVDQALAVAAAGRFGDGDLASILDHLAAAAQPGPVVVVDEPTPLEPGTAGWGRMGA